VGGADRRLMPDRNTEVLTFDGDDKVATVEVYFGWDL
jgi:hypothetical protein